MKKFFGLILFIFLIALNQCYAAKYSFLVLPNDLFINQKEYLVFQQSAHVISTDIINYYNQHPEMSAVPINQVKTYLEKPENYRLKKDVQKFLTEYQNNYTIDYSIVQKLAKIFGAKQVLLMACNMDAQNYITRRTMWDFLNVPGATVIDPAYRLSTQVTLIDPNNQVILWQHNYQKLISSRENRIIPTTYNAGSEQLEKVKKYSIKFLTPQIVQETQLALKNLSPYQNLNLHPEIVKPDYISIDKAKIDTKRTAVRSRKAIARWGRSRKTNVKTYFKNKKEYNALPTDKKMDVLQNKFDEKLYKQEQRQQIKFEKAKQRQELKAAKEKIKLENKYELQKQKIELQKENYEHNIKLRGKYTTDIEPVTQFKPQKTKKSRLNVFKKKKNKSINIEQNTEQQQKEQNINNTQIEIVPEPIIKQDINSIPYIRIKPILRETDYTINDL